MYVIRVRENYVNSYAIKPFIYLSLMRNVRQYYYTIRIFKFTEILRSSSHNSKLLTTTVYMGLRKKEMFSLCDKLRRHCIVSHNGVANGLYHEQGGCRTAVRAEDVTKRKGGISDVDKDIRRTLLVLVRFTGSKKEIYHQLKLVTKAIRCQDLFF